MNLAGIVLGGRLAGGQGNGAHLEQQEIGTLTWIDIKTIDSPHTEQGHRETLISGPNLPPQVFSVPHSLPATILRPSWRAILSFWNH